MEKEKCSVRRDAALFELGPLASAVGESTIEAWVAMGKFPAPKRIGPHGMRRWDWRDAERHIEGQQDNDDVSIFERITNATREAGKHTARDGLEEAVKEAEAGHAARLPASAWATRR
jgi:predicted DNA-binding transcriptional regulator AlpA